MRILPSLPTGVPRRRTSGESWTRFTKIASSARTCDREERRTYPEDRSRSCPPGSDFQREGCPPSKSQRLHRLDVAWDLSVIRLNPAEIRETETPKMGGALCSRRRVPSAVLFDADGRGGSGPPQGSLKCTYEPRLPSPGAPRARGVVVDPAVQAAEGFPCSRHRQRHCPAALETARV